MTAESRIKKIEIVLIGMITLIAAALAVALPWRRHSPNNW
jgi:hypothetical protein